MTIRSRSWNRLRSVVVAALALGVAWFGVARVWPFTVDDSGIAYAYAKHFAAGQGPRAVVGGPIVEGYSDFSWVAVLAVATKLGFYTPSAAKVLGVALFAVTCLAAMSVVRRLRRPGGRGIDWPEAMPVVLMALCPEFIVWAPSGLENALYWALMMTLLVLDLREAERPSLAPYSAAAAVGICITRPEGVLYAAVVSTAKLFDAIRARDSRRQFALFLGFAVAALGVYHAIHYATFRSFVPNTYYAKAPAADAWAKGKQYVKAALRATHLLWAIPLAFGACVAGLRKTLPALGCMLAALGFAAYSGGDWMPHYRFVGFAVPPLVTLAAVGVARGAAWPSRWSRGPVVEAWLVTAATLAVCWASWAYNGRRFERTRFLRWCHFCSRLQDARNHETLRDRLGLRAASMLTHDFGGPAFASSPSFRPIDLLGLCDQPLALLSFEQKRTGLPRFDILRAQYFLHEQDAYPTLLYFPENFWTAFSVMPEARFAYVDVMAPARSDGRLIAPTRVARSAFVDFFPYVDRFVFEDVDDRFVLVGTGAFRTSGRPFLLVALSQREPGTDPVSLTARAGGVPGDPVELFGRQPELGIRFFRGEPLVVALPLPASVHGERTVDFSIASAGKTVTVNVGVVSLDALRPRPAPLPFPNNLPGTSDPGLMALGARVRELVARRYQGGDLALFDVILGRQLVDVADRAEKTGASSDGYLSLVWAVQADPDLLRLVYRRIAALRPGRRRAPFLEERALLGAFYASRDPLVQLDLVHFYAGIRQWEKAEYFADRLPALRPDTAAAQWTNEVTLARRIVQARRAMDSEPSAVRAVPIPGTASDFEGEPLGWTRDGAAFDVVKDDERVAPIWGVEGEHYFSSGGPSERGRAATGRAESPPFIVDGRLLSFLVVGDASPRLNIELVVDGKAVLHATGPNSRYFFFPVVWDLRSVHGKRAVLTLSDSDPHGYIAVDHLRMWPELAAPPEG